MKKTRCLSFLILLLNINSFAQTCINYTAATGLPSESAIRVHVGNDGAINFGCMSSGGLMVYKNNAWENYTLSNSDIPMSTVYSLEDGNTGKLWLGDYYSGLSCFDISSETWQHFTTTNSDLPSNWVNGIANNGDNSLWIGTQNGLVKMNTQTNGMEIFTPSNSTIQGNSQIWLTSDQNGSVWFYCYNYSGGATPLGLGRFDGSNFELFNTTNSALTSNDITALSIISDTIWIATYNSGLFSFSNGVWNVYNTENSNLPSSGYFSSIKSDNTGRIWLAHHGYGLYCKDGATFTRYTKANGLLSNYLSSIDLDIYNNVWVAYGSDGVSVFNSSDLVIPSSIIGKVYLNSTEVSSNQVECYLYNIEQIGNPISVSDYTNNGFNFLQILPGTYFIHVKVISDNLNAADTYYDSASLWSESEMLFTVSDSAYNYDINLIPIEQTIGNCTIQGQIFYSGSQKSSVGIPDVNVFVMTFDDELSAIAHSDDQGIFTFENLSNTDGYKIIPDIAGYENIAYYENVNFSEQSQTLSGFIFYVDTVENSINTIDNQISTITGGNLGIYIYPNPAQNEVTLISELNIDLLSFEILNILGDIVYEGELRNCVTLPIIDLFSGIYIIKFSNGVNLKFIKEDRK